MSAFAEKMDPSSASKDSAPTGVSSPCDDHKAGEAVSAASVESAGLAQARDLLEKFFKKHFEVTDGSTSASSSNAGQKQSSDLPRLRDQIWELFSPDKTDIDYLESPAFRNKVRLVDHGCVKHPKKKKFHLKELIDNMNVNPPKTEEQRKQVYINRNRNVAKSSEKLVEKLGEKLTEIIEEINKVEQQDGFEEDEQDDEADGVEMECNYVYLDRLKRRAVVLYSKIQELECNPTTTMRESYRPITVRCSTCPEVNRAAGKMATRCIRKDLTPDFTDVVAIVRRVNEKENLGMSDDRQRSVAQQVFREIVEEIKKRRIKEIRSNMESLEIEFAQQDESDPADKDPELEARLKASEAQGRDKIAAVINEFADRQASSADGKDESSSDGAPAASKKPKKVDAEKVDTSGELSSLGAKSSSNLATKAPCSSKSSDGDGRDRDNGKNERSEGSGGEVVDGDDADDVESEMDESYLNSEEESEEEKDKKDRPIGKKVRGGSEVDSGRDGEAVHGAGADEDDDERELSKMALEAVGHRDGCRSPVAASANEKDDSDDKSEERPRAEGVQSADNEAEKEGDSNSSAASTADHEIRSNHEDDDANCMKNSAGCGSGEGDDARTGRKISKPKDEHKRPEVHRPSKDGLEAEGKASSSSDTNNDHDSMEMIFVESVDDDDDDSSPRPKSNGNHSQPSKENRANPRTKKRSVSNTSRGDDPPPKRMAVIELSDDSQDEGNDDEPESVASDDNATPYGISIAGRLRALGTNVVPVGEPVPHKSPEVIEIDSD